MRSIRVELQKSYILLVSVALVGMLAVQAVAYFILAHQFGTSVETSLLAGVLGVSVVFILVALAVLRGMRGSLAEAVVAPVNDFTQTFKRAVERRDRAFRFVPGKCGELNELANVCNILFADIETHDADLTSARTALQSQVQVLRHQISERKLAQAASARLTAILEATPDFVGTFDPVGSLLYLNRSARIMIGASENAVVSTMKFADFHPGWATRIISIEGIPGALHAGSWSGETAVRHSDGREIHVSQVIVAHRNATGGLEYFSTIMRDITERREAEEALRISQEKLLESSRLAGRAEVATGVLHNVGNVLNSVNVSAGILVERVRKSRAPKLVQAAAMLTSRNGDLGEWITKDPTGAKLPSYFAKLGQYFTDENSALLAEIEQLAKNIEHIKEVVAMQQSYAKVSGAFENLIVDSVVEDAISFNAGVLKHHKVQLERDFKPVPKVRADRHKVLQILVNLIRNARFALDEMPGNPRKIAISIEATAEDTVTVTVSDTGIGIPEENMVKIFGHGFTTRKDGHGFGLHSGALSAREMGGTLTVRSEGIGRGAAFALSLPALKE